MEILPVTRRLVRWLVRCGSATTLVLVVTSAFGQDFKYTINNGTITITGYTGIGGSVAIPDEIGGLPVTVIGYRAFVSTPVTDVTIPQSVTNIGGSAFLGCEGLTNLTMANGVTSVEGNAFAECWGLSVVRIPASVTSIGENAFFDCHGLQAFAVDGQNSAYCSVNGVLFNKSQSTLVQCPETRAGVYTIPNGVTKIGSSAFNSCFRLTEVSMGDGIVDIGDHAFADCSGLTNVVLPESVITIGFRAFYYCRSLRNITMSSNVASIGESGFGMCTSLAGITIPGSVTNIGAQAFSYCSDLKAITVDALNSAYSSVDGVLFDKSQTTLIQYPGGKTGSYTVPDLVRSVGDYAFSYCFGLTTVTIPNSVTNLGYFAFYQCRCWGS